MAKKKSSKKENKGVPLELDKSQKNLIGYVLGIVSIVVAFLSPIGAVVFGIIGLTQSRSDSTR